MLERRVWRIVVIFWNIRRVVRRLEFVLEVNLIVKVAIPLLASSLNRLKGAAIIITAKRMRWEKPCRNVLSVFYISTRSRSALRWVSRMFQSCFFIAGFKRSRPRIGTSAARPIRGEHLLFSRPPCSRAENLI